MTTALIHNAFAKEDLLALHQILGEYEVFLARRHIPPLWNADEVEDVRKVEAFLEKIVK